MEPSPEELERRRQWFEWYVEQQASNSVRSPKGEAGPNGRLSLTEARANYRRVGACEERFIDDVRPPRPEERPT